MIYPETLVPGSHGEIRRTIPHPSFGVLQSKDSPGRNSALNSDCVTVNLTEKNDPAHTILVNYIE